MENLNVKFVDLGAKDGVRTIEVYDADTGEKIGYNQKLGEKPEEAQ
jgi:hypothetical protein